jgi:hypothetical protein
MNNQPVILSDVEISLSEERGEIASRKAMRDLVTNLGGFLMGCYIDSKVTQTCSEIPSSLSLLAFTSFFTR